MRLIKQTALIFLLSTIYYLPSRSVQAQSLSSDDVNVKIENIELKTSDKPAHAPQPPEEFRRQGFIVQTLEPDKTSSSPFALTPAAFLIRAKPGSTFLLPLTIHNFKDPAVLQLEFVPFVESSSKSDALNTVWAARPTTAQQISIDCNRVKVAPCLALDWLSLPTALRQNLFIEAGGQEEFDLSVQIPDTAQESDYYIKLRLSEFQKPYHYTSTDLYITVTKSGIIDQNISINKMLIQSDAFKEFESVAFTVIDSRDKPTLTINVSNGSPYFLPAAVTLKIRSPLGFEVNKVLPPIVLLANQSKVVTSKLENLPFGLATITVAEGAGSVSISLFALPYIGYIIVGSIILSASLALWIFARKNNML